MHGRQRRTDDPGHQDVVESRKRQVLRDPHSSVPKIAHQQNRPIIRTAHERRIIPGHVVEFFQRTFLIGHPSLNDQKVSGIRLDAIFCQGFLMSDIPDIIYSLHIVRQERDPPVPMLQKIFRHLISAFLVFQPDIHIIHDVSRRITVDQHDGILIPALDLDKIIMKDSKEYQPVHIPGQHITDQLRDLIGCIDHHKIPLTADLRLDRAKQHTEERIRDQIVILPLPSLQRNSYDLRALLRKASCTVIRDIIIFF